MNITSLFNLINEIIAFPFPKELKKYLGKKVGLSKTYSNSQPCRIYRTVELSQHSSGDNVGDGWNLFGRLFRIKCRVFCRRRVPVRFSREFCLIVRLKIGYFSGHNLKP
jgi:hypothetical protein